MKLLQEFVIVVYGCCIVTGFIRSFIVWLVRLIWNDHIFADVIGATRKKTVTEYWAWTVARDEYERTFNKQVRENP